MPDKTSPSLRDNITWYATLLLIALIALVPTLLCGIFYLSRVPDVTWQRGDLTRDRIWLARFPQPVGIGLESQRVVQNYNNSEACVVVNVRYLLWSRPRNLGEDLNVSYRQSFTRTEHGWQVSSSGCRLP